MMKALKVVPVTFLPRLVSFDVIVTGHKDMDYIPYLQPHNSFVSMLKARRAGNEDGLFKLRKFRFCLCPGRFLTQRPSKLPIQQTVFNDHEISVLRGLVEDGMSLNIRFEGVLAFDSDLVVVVAAHRRVF
ncbi:hypothetical protein BDZ89DRAFT_121361 [Hymenopellis radicata]|nr:hypothetical protein BDZ89DRAFT_121361 [Hymenopellis radicata]